MTEDWLQLDRERFAELCANLNGKQIAEMFGVTPGAVYYRMRLYSINGSRYSRRFKPPREEIEALYRSMSMKKVAEHYGVGETTVFMYLKQLGIGGVSRTDRLLGKPKTLEHRMAMSQAMRASGSFAGSRNANWKGGVTKENLRGRSKAQYMEWKSAVYAKAGWKCQHCGLEHGAVCECCGHRVLLHAHHIKAFDKFPDLRYEPSNGLALCERCHWKVHYKESGELLETPESPSATA